MRLAVFLLLIVECWCDIQVRIDSTGGYNVTVGNQVWLRSSRTAVYADDRWYSTENNTLSLISINTTQGTDSNLGDWNETQLIYSLVRRQASTTVVARIRQWSLVSAFTFHLDTGDKDLTNRISLDMEEVRTVFPSFKIEEIDENDDRGYFTLGGRTESSLFRVHE